MATITRSSFNPQVYEDTAFEDMFKPVPVSIPKELVENLESAEIQIKQIETAKKAVEEKAKAYRKSVMEAMEKFGVQKMVMPNGTKITLVAATVREGLDTERLKTERPDIYTEYGKTSDVKAYIKVTLSKNLIEGGEK